MLTESGLLTVDEPAPYEVLQTAPAFPALLVCDHASNRVPRRLNGLGISPTDLETHFAVDIGAASVTRALHTRLGLPAVLCAYSRLVVDCNRRLDNATAFPLSVEDIVVPGNQGLTQQERQARADAIYWPYHHAVRDELARLESLAAAPALIAIHSFTPELDGTPRPWHVGVLWDQDPRIPTALLEALGAMPNLVVGDNQPYPGRHPYDFTIDHHAEAAGLAHVAIEIRQDLIADAGGARAWADRLSDVLLPVLADEDLYTHWTA